MATINIPSYLDDPNYRYKMPRIKAKIEGRGNGIKTNIMNMGDIARSLKRPPEYPTRFCGCELGSQSKFELAEGKAIVNGAHTEGDLQVLIDKFIERFVLCPNCRLPEVDLFVAKSRVRGKCNACGYNGDMDNIHKVGTYILKNPPDGGDSTMGKKAGKKSKEERQRERAEKATKRTDSDHSAGHGGEEGVSNGETSLEKKTKKDKKDKEKKEKKDKKEKDKVEKKEEKEKDKSRDKDKKKTKSSKDKTAEQTDDIIATVLTYDSAEIDQVIARLHTFLTRAERPSPGDFFQEVRLLQVAQDFTSTLRVYVALAAILQDKVDVPSLHSNMPYLSAICDRSIEGDMVLEAIEQLIFRRSPASLSIYSRLCSELYNNDIIEEDTFLSRYVTNDKKLSGDEYEKAKAAACPFLTWLQAAESASDESDKDGEESSSSESENIDEL